MEAGALLRSVVTRNVPNHVRVNAAQKLITLFSLREHEEAIVRSCGSYFMQLEPLLFVHNSPELQECIAKLLGYLGSLRDRETFMAWILGHLESADLHQVQGGLIGCARAFVSSVDSRRHGASIHII